MSKNNLLYLTEKIYAPVLLLDNKLIDKIEWHALDGIDDNALKFIKDELVLKGVNSNKMKIVVY